MRLPSRLDADRLRPRRPQDRYPSKPVRIIVSFSAGGPTDIVARVMGAKMGEMLGQQFVVENRTGAGGNTGAADVARSAPDGYTLLMATVSTHAINPGLYSKMPYDPIKDFAPISQVGVTPTIFGVNPSMPATDVKSLIELVKDNPGKYTFGSSGVGSILHLCGEQFKAMAGGLNMLHVPYRGSAPMMSDLIGGQISMAFDANPEHSAAGAGRQGPRARRRHGGAHEGDAEPADLAGAGHEGLRVLHLERDPGAGRHAAADRRPAGGRDQEGDGRPDGAQAPGGGRRRSDAGPHLQADRRLHQGGAGEMGADHQGVGRAGELDRVASRRPGIKLGRRMFTAR